MLLFFVACIMVPANLQLIKQENCYNDIEEFAAIKQQMLETKRPFIVSKTKVMFDTFTSRLQTLENQLSETLSALDKLQNKFTQDDHSNGRVLTFVHDNFSFDFSEDKMTCAQAKTKCQTKGGYLAIVDSKATNDFLKNVGINHGYYFIGGHDKGFEELWVWDHVNLLIVYTNWKPGEPNKISSAHEDCLGLLMDQQAVWNDFPCTSKLNYICQKRLR